MQRLRFGLKMLFATSGLWLAAVLASVGYMVAPLLFAQLMDVEAGRLVGILLQWTQGFALLWVGLAVLFERFYHARWKGLLLVLMLLLAVNLFGLGPQMEALKQAAPAGLSQNSESWKTFMMLHGIYQLGYLSVILLLVVWSLENLNKWVVRAGFADKNCL